MIYKQLITNEDINATHKFRARIETPCFSRVRFNWARIHLYENHTENFIPIYLLLMLLSWMQFILKLFESATAVGVFRLHV